jgi:hypothetical protein
VENKRSVGRTGGREVKNLGDGLMVNQLREQTSR